MSECLYQEITACLANGCLLHLSNLLSLLIAIIQIDKGCKFSGELKTSFDAKLSLLYFFIYFYGAFVFLTYNVSKYKLTFAKQITSQCLSMWIYLFENLSYLQVMVRKLTNYPTSLIKFCNSCYALWMGYTELMICPLCLTVFHSGHLFLSWVIQGNLLNGRVLFLLSFFFWASQ